MSQYTTLNLTYDQLINIDLLSKLPVEIVAALSEYPEDHYIVMVKLTESQLTWLQLCL